MAVKEKKQFSPRPYSNGLMASYKIRCDRTATLWLYDPVTGLWSNNGEKLIEQKLREWDLKPDDISNYHVREVISDLKYLNLKDKDFPPPPPYLIPFKNVVYDLKTKVFSDFKPEYNFTSKLVVKYNPNNSGCPLIDKIFRELVKLEDLSDLYELPAYCLLPAYPNEL